MITLEQYDPEENKKMDSILNLVDLAGSEKISHLKRKRKNRKIEGIGNSEAKLSEQRKKSFLPDYWKHSWSYCWIYQHFVLFLWILKSREYQAY